jgi:glycine cleavage system H protein
MSALTPENLRYTKEHEWAQLNSNIVTVGITDFAQQALGDVVFVELPDVGTSLAKDDTFGVVESIKSVSDLYSPVAGEVVEKNEQVESSPELINKNPYDAWLLKIKVSNDSEFKNLLSAANYQEFCKNS